MRGVRLVVHQFRYELVEFAQNAQSRFFTLALPVILLLIFVAILGSHHTLGHTGIATLKTYYVPAMLAFGVVWASVINLAVNLTVAREEGVLKRRHAAPVPAWAFITARSLTAVILSLLIVVLLLAVGVLAFGVGVSAARLPGLLIAVVVGSLAFCCMGYALVTFVASEDGALPVILGIALPLYFISGVFIEYAAIPHAIRDVATALPVRHLAAAMLLAFDRHASGAAIAGRDLLVVVAWGAVALVLALRRFSWEPRGA
jgi:ABC-2 type transport system permease protein